MGYTHYWNGTIKKDEWKQAMPELEDVLRRHRDILCAEFDDVHSLPVLDENILRFNGKGVSGHETFLIGPGTFDPANPYVSGFCKTACKPYDVAVCECLLILDKYCKGFNFSSDGDVNKEPAWLEAKANVAMGKSSV